MFPNIKKKNKTKRLEYVYLRLQFSAKTCTVLNKDRSIIFTGTLFTNQTKTREIKHTTQTSQILRLMKINFHVS